MVKDLNRNITSIEYNSSNLRPKAVKIGCTSGKKEKTPLFSLLSTRFALSLPRQITFYDGTKMKLTYDAAGNKLRAEYWTIPTFNPGGPIGPASTVGGNEPMGGGIVGPILPPINQNDPQVVTDYCGNLIYRNDTLTMLLMEEGYVTFATSGTPTYHYYLKDHLGNVRIVMSQDGTVDQRNQYYPDGTLFGKQSTGGTVQPYKFGQKELERTLPLDEYDFGARWMDPVVGARFTTMDPLCEKYYGISPYAYCGNNPVNAVDPDGMEPVYNMKGEFLGTTSEGFTGDIMIYTGFTKINFESFNRNDLEQNMSNFFMTYDTVNGVDRDGLSDETKSKIWTNLVSHFEGTHIYDEVFSISSIPGNSIQLKKMDNASWFTNKETMKIYGTDEYDYETTIENLASSIIVHEWYSHAQKKTSDFYKSHRLAYKNVINWKPFWNKTTNKYKRFCLFQLRNYTQKETGRSQVDPLYRNLYNRYAK